MLPGLDLPKLSEIPSGWRLVRAGKAKIGDKHWRPMDRSWMPLVWADKKHDMDVNLPDMPVIIRKELE